MSITPTKLEKLLVAKCGFQFARSKAGYHIYARQDGGKEMEIKFPHHVKEIPPGTSSAIAKQIGFSCLEEMKQASACHINETICGERVRGVFTKGGRHVHSTK